jgi:hypothetical protein
VETVKLSPDDLAETIDVAHDYLRGTVSDDELRSWGSTREFAQALVQLSGSCVVGAPCGKHYESIHGKEAEELRAGVEKLLAEYAPKAPHDDAWHDYHDLRRSLIKLLDEIEACDSLAFCEATDPPDESAAAPA